MDTGTVGDWNFRFSDDRVREEVVYSCGCCLDEFDAELLLFILLASTCNMTI